MKAGTTYLYNCIVKHPNITPNKFRKECHFWDRYFNRGYKWYESLFPEGKITGEISGYVWHPFIAYEIKRHYPNALILIMMRNPIDRAYSHYWHNRNPDKKRYPKWMTFENAIAREMKIKSYLHYGFNNAYPLIGKGIYANYVPIWKSLFNTVCIKAEEFFKNPQPTLNKIFQKLDVKPMKINVKGARKNPTAKHKPMNPKTRKKLKKFFEEPNKLLKKMCGITW